MTQRSVHFTNAWHGSSGGIRTFYDALLAGAERHRRHVTLVVPGEHTRCERRGGYSRIYSIRAPRSPLFDRRYRLLLPHRYLAAANSAVWRILEREQPDVIETCDKYVLPYFNGLLKRRVGNGPRPTLIGLSCERLDDNIRAWVGRGPVADAAARGYLRRVYLPLFDGHIANSEYTAQELRDVMARHADTDWRLRRLEGQIRVGPMGVDVDDFSPGRRSDAARRQLIKKLGGDAGTRLMLYAGRISPEKHIMVLPAMMRQLHARGANVRLVVCGDGPLRKTFERVSAAEAPGCTAILGHVSRSVLSTLLASADVFVHPNPREPFGIGPLEAMASGLPVVLPRAGGVLSYATDGNSWLTSPTPEALADTVSDLFARPVLREIRRQTALRDVQSQAWPAAVATYFAHYDQMDEARRMAAPALFTPSRVYAGPQP